jgi:uncharacterized protein (TIGR03085 family)
MGSVAQFERIALAAALEAAGPEAPTLCTGWTARDLAAHIVLRERNPLAAFGVVVPALAGHRDRVQKALADRPWAELLRLVRARSTLLPDRLDRLINTTEFFVHTEDVRRAAAEWSPRPVEPHREAAMTRFLETSGRTMFRRAEVGVMIRLPGRDDRELRPATPDGTVTLAGPATEVTLYAFGRTGAALVEITGDENALAVFGTTDLRD